MKPMRSLWEKRQNDNSGFVLVTVIGITLALTILAITLMSANVSQSISSQHQIERIKAEQLAKGGFWYNYMSLINSGSEAPDFSETLDGKTYNVVITPGVVGPPNSTTPYNVVVSYPTY